MLMESEVHIKTTRHILWYIYSKNFFFFTITKGLYSKIGLKCPKSMLHSTVRSDMFAVTAAKCLVNLRQVSSKCHKCHILNGYLWVLGSQKRWVPVGLKGQTQLWKYFHRHSQKVLRWYQSWVWRLSIIFQSPGLLSWVKRFLVLHKDILHLNNKWLSTFVSGWRRYIETLVTCFDSRSFWIRSRFINQFGPINETYIFEVIAGEK